MLVWIAFSDRVADALADGRARGVLHLGMGAAFAALSAAILLALIRSGERAAIGLAAEIRSAVDAMADGVLVVDEAGRVVEANRAAAELLGVPSKDDLLRSLDDWAIRFVLRAIDGAPVPSHRFAPRSRAGERATRYDGILRRADGRDVFVAVAASPVERPEGPQLTVNILRDVSAARRLDELREEFISVAAHEFKTPLAVVKAYAQLMQRREPSEAQPLAVIQRQVDRLSRLVQHLLDVSRLRQGASEGRRDRFDLSALAAEIVERMRPTTPAHELRVEAPAPAPVLADRDRIACVLTSLLDNAVRFSPAGGPIQARIDVANGEALVSVGDRGLGIPRERQERIFERYYRAHAGTPEDYGGLGLGLDTSREIVQGHGGRMWFESEPGEGSTFHFSLPLDERIA